MSTNGSERVDSSRVQAGASRSRQWVVWAGLATVVVAGGALALWRRPSPQPPVPAVANQDDDVDEPASPDPGYLGPQACVACHAARVKEFQATNHMHACRLAQADTMPSGFAPGQGVHPTRYPGLRFEMTQSGDEFLQTAIRTTPTGEQRTPARIGLAYGAGGLDEVYFTWHDDRLYELPMAWLHPLNRWGNTTVNRYGSGDFSRETTPRCLECHNTYFEYVPGTSNQYHRDSFILGVTCERCHGPGREHVAFHQAHPEAEAAHAVVHPGRLTRDRQVEVCIQCHSNASKGRTAPFRYRPGEPLDAYFKTAVSKYAEDDHVANQIQYLRRSKCFQQSDTLTCTTCHNPHRRTNPELVAHACLKCHQPANCAEQERLPAAVRSDCVGCHMPSRVWINVYFHTADDEFVPPIRRHEHRIAVYPTARQEVLLAWHRSQPGADNRREADRLTRALVEYWLAEAEDRRRNYRFLAAVGAVREALRLDNGPATRAKLREAVAALGKLQDDLAVALHSIDDRRVPEAIDMLTKILAVKPDHATAHAKLGTLYATSGQQERAVEHLQAVAHYDPNDAYGYTMLGWLAYVEGRAEDAVAAYQRADEIEPFAANINYQMGLALMKLGRLPEAVERFRRALTIDPNHAGSCQGLSHALRQQGEAAEAVRFAHRAARLTGFHNPDVLITLADAYTDAGRRAEARDTAMQALDVAEASSPNLVPLIRRRLEELRP